MAYRDTEVDPIPHVPDAPSVPAPPDWRRLYEQTLERAEAPEARAEELKWAEVVARGTAGSLKWQFKEARRKRLEAVEDANQARRAAKNALFLDAEVARLSRLLEEAGLDPHLRGREISLRREVHRLRKAVPGPRPRPPRSIGCASLCGSRTTTRPGCAICCTRRCGSTTSSRAGTGDCAPR